MSLAEKFQITIPYVEKLAAHDKWATFDSQRITSGNPSPCDGEQFNHLPTTRLVAPRSEAWVEGFGGDTDVSGGSGGLDPTALAAGFKRRDMKATDDQYGGEHVDLFYGDVVDERGNMSFVERNNYLDRL